MQTSEVKPSKKTASKTLPADKPKKAAATKKAASPKVESKAESKASRPKKAKSLDADLRHQLITETAHFLSEKRCYGASEIDDWLFAEKLVDGVSGALR